MKVRNLLIAVALAGLLAPAYAQAPVTVAPADIQSLLSAQKGKRVMIRTRSGGELTGEVRDVNAKVVVLGALQGREFFDAVVAVDAVEAVQVRTKQ